MDSTSANAQHADHDDREREQPREVTAIGTVQTSAHAPVTPASSGPATGDAPTETIPAEIGPYRIKHVLGRGGMGVVYLAIRRVEGVHQRVALKLLKRGVDTDEVLNRFEQERHLLGSLNHPNLARLIDAGSTDDGRPYLVMEYVEGEPIDKYCNNNRLGIRERLALFSKLCEAVQYLHQNLVIHRDLKPGNVMVTANGEVKVLDLGIAKIINPNLVDMTVLTGPEVRLMTPEYASPEQVSGRPITTTTDIYALGVILYELVTGRRPYRFRTRLHDEIVRIICEVDPERPSTAISHAEDVPQADGSTRRMGRDHSTRLRASDSRHLKRRLSGDIDDMILMAMDKVPTRRYQSAEQFASDIERHLNGLPILARRTSRRRLYTLAKFARRNRTAVAAVIAVIASLSVGLGAAVAAWQDAEAARLAEQEAKQAEVEVRTEKEKHLGASLTLARSMMTDIHSNITKLAASTEAERQLAEAALKYLQSLEAESAGDPQVDEALAIGYLRLGQIQSGLRSSGTGETAAAIESFERSKEIWKSLAEREPEEETYETRLWQIDLELGKPLYESGELGRAERVQAAALERAPMPEDPQVPEDRGALLRRAIALKDHGETLARLGRLEDAERELMESVELRRLAIDPATTSESMLRYLSSGYIALGSFLNDRERAGEALDWLEEAEALRRRAMLSAESEGRYEEDLAVTLYEMSRSLRMLGRADEALEKLNEAEQLVARLESLDRTDVRIRHRLALIRREVARSQLASGEAQEADRTAMRALTMVEDLADADQERLDYRALLADLLDARARAELALGDAGRAIVDAERSVSIRTRVSEGMAASPLVQLDEARSRAILAEALAQGSDADREAARREALEALRALETLGVTTPSDAARITRLEELLAQL